MQAVILCAGKGTRMGDLTKNLPKPLLEINSKSLIEYKLEKLPSYITEVILVIGYLGEKIKDKFGSEYLGKKITYVEDMELTGTAKALWQAKNILKSRFIVMMGDDIYDSQAISECAKNDFSLVCINADRETSGSRVVLDENGQPKEFQTHLLYIKNFQDGGKIFTGLYSMTDEIFNYQPVKMDLSDEWSLPKTFLQVRNKHNIKIVEANQWVQITKPEDLNQNIKIQ